MTRFNPMAAFGSGASSSAGSGLADLSKAAAYAEQFKKMGMTPDTAGLLGFATVQKEYEGSPSRLQEQIAVLGPYFKDVARENQRLGMEANLFKGFMDLPDKFSRAMAAQHYYMPETMQTIAGNIGRETPWVNRQYVQL